jgi:hypothetical protein
MSTLYDSAVPADDDNDRFAPLDADNSTDDDTTASVAAGAMTTDWSHEEAPLRWLFIKDGRGKLVIHAMSEVEDDPVFENKSALAKSADISRHSVHRHIDELVSLGLYEERGGEGTYDRYRPNEQSLVLQTLIKANEQIVKYR